MLELTERWSDAHDSQKRCCGRVEIEAHLFRKELPNLRLFILVGLE